MTCAFPRRTSATPRDPLAFVGEPPLTIPDADAVHVSCAFSWDMPAAETLARSWSRFGLPVTIGGPATGQRGDEFTPGMYLRHGYVITSRGCPNQCWFCNVWRREGALRELPIPSGWIVQDDNLLACSADHIRAVFDMLRAQPEPVQFTGGIEAALLRPWHVDLLTTIRVGQLFCAYDGPEDLEPLRQAGKLLNAAGYTYANRKARAYVLCGHPRDTLANAERRMRETVAAGYMPQSMLWRDQHNKLPGVEWQRFHRSWARPAAIASQVGTVRQQRDEHEQRTLPGTEQLADAAHVASRRAEGGE